MELRVHRHGSVDDFLEAAGAFLGEREAEHNLLFGICTAVRVTPELFADDPPRFLTLTDAGGRLVGASLRTPPYNQVVSELDDPPAVDALVDALRDEELPGVTGPKEHAANFVERWTQATGASARLAVAERIFRLDRVVPPSRPPAGRWRMAEPSDRRIVADWLVAFGREALPDDEPPPDPLATADRWIAGRYRSLYLWEDDGRVVSLAGAGGETPNGIRIGPVYTPPDARRRGYATALAAAASRDQLERGRRFCFLFTDLSNPTSNSIYGQIGYRPVRDVDMYRFGVDA
jgi:predicted GNAT family acetyltransferase